MYSHWCGLPQPAGLLTAEMVERAEQWNLLRRFQLDGAELFLGQPQPAKVAA
ncbi:MAG: hypothetical protein R3F47_16605 [Gammaproteobacteria bacterium]